jgi:hypothetical protein
MYLGLGINLIIFYQFNRCFPFFIFPGICSIGIVVVYAIYGKEFYNFSDLRRQERSLVENKSKIVKEYPLQIIGADESRDFNEMVNNLKYIPPNVISELEGITEESPKDKEIFETSDRKESGNKIKF